MRTIRGWLGIAFVVAATSAASGGGQIKVFCPAVSQHDKDEGYADVPSDILPVALMVVGSLDPEAMTLKVDRTLFGPALSEVNLTPLRSGYSRFLKPTPQIYCLSLTQFEWRPNLQPGGGRVRTRTSDLKFAISEYFEGRRIFHVEDEPVMAALGQARLDVLVLGSSTIFVGRPDQATSVAVERVLYGEQVRAGETVRVAGTLDPYPSASGSYIYFVNDSEPSKREGALKLQRRWPDTEVPLVEATLKRRSLFPVRNGQQEITLTGTVREAIAFMGTHLEVGQTLAARRLISDSAAALPEVTAFIEDHLLVDKANDLAGYDHQMNVIRVLGLMENHRLDGEIVRLISLMLDRIQAGATFPHRPDRSAKDSRLSSRYLPTDANHSLLWLLMTLEEPDVARLFGERLLKLRALAAYGWREEIQEYADRGHLEDRMELAAMRERISAVKPLKLSGTEGVDGKSNGHLDPITQVEFVRDGQRLRTTSANVICDWDPNNGSLLFRNLLQEQAGQQSSGQNKSAPGKSPARQTAKNGKPKHGETEISSEDGRKQYLFNVTDFGGKYGPPRAFSIAVRDDATRPWQVLGKIELKWGQHTPFGLVPDGKHLHFATQIFSRENLQLVSAANASGKIYGFQFFPDGSRYLLSTSENETRPGPLAGVTVSHAVLHRVRVHDTKTGRTLLALERPGGIKFHTAQSPDGRFLAIVDEPNAIEVWQIPGE